MLYDERRIRGPIPRLGEGIFRQLGSLQLAERLRKETEAKRDNGQSRCDLLSPEEFRGNIALLQIAGFFTRFYVIFLRHRAAIDKQTRLSTTTVRIQSARSPLHCKFLHSLSIYSGVRGVVRSRG